MSYSNYYLHPPVEEPWNFQGKRCINPGNSREGGIQVLEFQGGGGGGGGGCVWIIIGIAQYIPGGVNLLSDLV